MKHVLQALLNTIPKFDRKIGTPSEFNLFTESYGGHYGPAFFNYFYNQNLKIQNGSMPGYPLNFNSLGIINGIIDEYVIFRPMGSKPQLMCSDPSRRVITLNLLSTSKSI